MGTKCKQCRKDNNNGTNFCTRKCRMRWIKDHNIKGAKKRNQERIEEALMQLGSDFSNEEYFDRHDYE